MNEIRRFVEEGLRRYRRSDRSDVVEELVAHLEDVHAEALAEGLDAPAAMDLVREEAGDWSQLSREIAVARGEDMKGRIRKIFLPGFAGMIIGSIGMNLMRWMQVQNTTIRWIGPNLRGIGQRGFIALDPVMLGFMVLGGAVAAYLSKTFHGTQRQRLYAAELPSIVSGSLLMISLSLNLLLGIFFPKMRVDFNWMMYAFAGYMIGWVILPGIALGLGALPFLKEAHQLPPASAS